VVVEDAKIDNLSAEPFDIFGGIGILDAE